MKFAQIICWKTNTYSNYSGQHINNISKFAMHITPDAILLNNLRTPGGKEFDNFSGKVIC